MGVAQWLAAPGHPEANLGAALSCVAQARSMGAELVVLPELWLCGCDPATLPEDAAAAAVRPGDHTMEILARVASEQRIWLVAGSVPEREGDSLFNTCFVFRPTGAVVARHRKVHLYPPIGDDKVFAAGDRLTTFSDRSLGDVGIVVGFDGDFPEVGGSLARRGIRLVVAPTAFEVEAAHWWDLVSPALALVNGQWWVQANQCGRTGSGTFLGGSRVLAPSGTVIAEAARAVPGVTPPPEVVVRRIDLRITEHLEPTSDLLRHGRRPDVYS